MARSSGRRHDRSLIARIAVVVLAVGLVAQAGFMLREAADQLGHDDEAPSRAFLLDVEQLMADDATYAVTGGRTEYARYLLYPRRRIDTPFTEEALRASGVRYVIVSGGNRPDSLRGEAPWFRVLLTTRAGRLLELEP